MQEITTTANLQHPHILPLFDSGEADSFLYYVMPFIDGETLRDKLNRETADRRLKEIVFPIPGWWFDPRKDFP